MPRRILKPRRRGQEGQTLVLVAITLFVLIAMAALAIDVTTLYVARGEMQRAADAAALAGAKAFVDSGVTTAPAAPNPDGSNLQPLATSLATAYVTAELAQNKVGGVQPTLVGAVTPNYSTPGNPQITVTLQRTDVPTFFAHIFGRKLVTVQATAVAEAYNSLLPPGGGGSRPPVAAGCVKPWLIPNADPHNGGNEFIDHTTGALNKPGVSPAGIIGEEITLLNDCTTGQASCVPQHNPPKATVPDELDYLPAQLAAVSGTCPSCAVGSDYEQSSACCDAGNTSANTYACGASAAGVNFDLTTNTINTTVSSVECLINASGPGTGSGQDGIGLGPGAQFPADSFGNFLASNGNDPIEIQAGGGFHSGQLVTTSPSVVTLPIYDTTGVTNTLNPVKIIGFMQAFVEQTRNDGDIQIYVLNISGCGPNVNTGLTPVSGGGVSPIPVRLIHN